MKIAIVTGASSGMGRDMVIQLADRFSQLDEIWVTARRGDRLKELEDRVPVTLRKFTLDLTKPKDLEELKKTLAKVRPNVKFLVNAAGYGKIGQVGTISMEEESGMVMLNAQALCAVTHLVLPYLSNHSRIIQFASAASFMPQPNFAVYAATKSFVLSYSRALHAELKSRDIAVTAVCPGPVKTEFFDIAETGNSIPLYKKLVMADSKKVTALALRDSMMGKQVSTYGILMKLFSILCKLCPHSLLLKIMQFM